MQFKSWKSCPKFKRIVFYSRTHFFLHSPSNSTAHSVCFQTITFNKFGIDPVALKILDAWKKNEFLLAILSDLLNAFDTLDHKILLSYLNNIGIHGPSLQWLKPCLPSRSQATKVNGFVSEQFQISCGVPQGSILGPLLHLIYVSDIPSAMNMSNQALYFMHTTVPVSSW